jgi:CRP/FNR family transcriptional regulator
LKALSLAARTAELDAEAARHAFAVGHFDFLSLLTTTNQRSLLEHSRQVEYPAGFVAVTAGDFGRTFLLRRGLVRIYWAAPDGRETTITFIYPGNLVGAPLLVPSAAGVQRWPGSVAAQIVVDSTLTLLDLETVRRVVAREIEVVTAIATCLAARVLYDVRKLAVGCLGNIPERLAIDLLERATRTQRSQGRLEARATHQDLADSIGSSREVVSRTLKALRADKIVETAPGLTRILDPVRLATTVSAYVG